jgi:hypothetical protein
MNAYLPPLVIDVRVRETGSRSFRIWLPFFLLWPILFIVIGFVLLVTCSWTSRSTPPARATTITRCSYSAACACSPRYVAPT